MQMNRLRLLGFKSFVEPTELLIEKGLTGVVGPNGCGKSNLLEALRWVMGETSHKSMRAAAMDDVIFSGTVHRPARNSAEVTIFLDNRKRMAPADFNGSDTIEITRRIEREAGSAYRINGKEARARDVKLLFEDAAAAEVRTRDLLTEAEDVLKSAEQHLNDVTARTFEVQARRRSFESSRTERQEQAVKLERQLAALDAQARQIAAKAPDAVKFAEMQEWCERLAHDLADLE